MQDDLISVVVPAYNNGPWLPRCLDSLLAQTHAHIQIIVVNDGSRDNTREVLEAYTAGHVRIMAIHKENGGVTSARLAGVAAAEGGWIGFVDGDDFVEPDMYARLLENARSHGADISHCGHQILFPDGRVQYVHNTGLCLDQNDLQGVRDLLDGGQIDGSLCTKLFRRELFRGLEEWMDPAIKNGEDYLMNYHLFSGAKKAIYEDFCPYHYILRQGSASYHQLNEHTLFDPVQVRRKILASCPTEIRDDAHKALLRNILFAYGQLSLNRDRQYEAYRQRVRSWLKEEREFFHLFSVRNRILATMVCHAPWSFHLAYGLYVKLFQRQEQH